MIYLESNLLTSKENQALSTVASGDYRLCWSSYLHGISASKFHERCDGKAPTLSLFRIPRGIVGGYTDTTWSSKSTRDLPVVAFIKTKFYDQTKLDFS